METSSTGEEALAKLETQKPDLVILDIRMEGIDGIEVLRRMREAGNKTDVIMVTGVNEQEFMDRATELGAIGYIRKPLVLEELEKVVLNRILKK